MIYIHSKGLIYRDLNIDNMMLNSIFQSKLIDFGSAKVNECLFGEETMNSLSMTKGIGLGDFMSPEMMMDEDYDNKIDVYYFFYVILHFIFTDGMLHYSKKEKTNKKNAPLPKESDSISKVCIDLISKCLAIDPNDRPSFDEILIYLRKNNYMLASDVDLSLVSQRDTELESIKI